MFRKAFLSISRANTKSGLVTWNIAYRAGSFIFSHDDTYHFTLMDEPTSVWEDLPWSPPCSRRSMPT